jgi:hypothetical protein
VIDWFEPWPEQALRSVATVFLAEEDLPEACRAPIVEHMVMVHQSVRTFSSRFQVRAVRAGWGVGEQEELRHSTRTWMQVSHDDSTSRGPYEDQKHASTPLYDFHL